MMRALEIQTERSVEARDITDQIVAQLEGSGFYLLSCPHTTCALVLCEADAEMLSDIERCAAELLAPLEPFSHSKNDNPNAAAHLFASLMGTQLFLKCLDGTPQLGTYQRIVLLELDGPKLRRVQLDRVAGLAA